jgi:transcriptional regulator with XRE-family HTH domain
MDEGQGAAGQARGAGSAAGATVSVAHQPEGERELSRVDAVGGPTVLRMLVGGQLRDLREAAGISPDQAGYEIRGSRSKISRLEHGRVSFKERDVADLLTLYGVTDTDRRARMLALAQQANDRGWWAKYDDVLPDWFETYVGLEQATSLIRSYELQFVPGLFQTEDYARAVTILGHRAAPPDEVERRVSLRLKRQQLLAGPEPRVWAVIDESALRRPLGGRETMRGQLRHLLEIAELPQVTLQLMPFDCGGHSAAGGSFAILRFAEPDLPDIVYIEQLTGALYLDRREETDHYREVMNSLSAEAETPADSERLLKRIIRAT